MGQGDSWLTQRSSCAHHALNLNPEIVEKTQINSPRPPVLPCSPNFGKRARSSPMTVTLTDGGHPDYDCLAAASRLARYSRSPSSTELNASYLDSTSEISFDLVLANLAATFTAPLARK